ncbi:Membrane-associated protease RseP, regulator of RpoE activity [Georgenia satyanarayanai]|uniref:Membrane-associated protease RseP, regulator of RpoE activity n=1 Tax=Georgenia satyanarayanai TaxID=860221 RepID=A0A2Y9AF40_9MICO|nr:site-2 protease family protein [Georgenia satyanarayanai]PYF99898.1 membrane-associated protease RseP (regulator of RpoE activity) [Georgenia satyanarayanai]SSA41898.1 Membrane-associated protease RseP, regulator of RpoE activity [Georgenia satyanarayanai]
MSFLVGVLVLVVGLVISIALHEVGHLVPAKRFGVKVTEYFVGFGPTLWSRRRGETEYGVKAVPLGGYVRMVGMYPPARSDRPVRRRRDGRATLVEEAREYALAEVGPGEEHRTFSSLSVPKKLVVMLGGPVMNLLIAVVLLSVVLVGVGVPAYTATLGNVQECLPADQAATECSDTDPAAPGEVAGLQPGDTVVSWGGRPVEGWDDVRAAIAASGPSPATVVVERDGQERTVTVTPAMSERPVVVDGEVLTDDAGEPVTEPQPFVGIGPVAELVPQPVSAVPGRVVEAVGATFEVVLTLPQRLVDVAQAAFGEEERDPGVVGLVGVGRFAGEIASIDSERYGVVERAADLLGLLASLNLALFVFNLIPLLPLDGGHIAGALWEGLRRRVAAWRGRPDPGPVDVARMLPLTYVVVVAMVGMSLLLAYADIVRPVTLTG